MLLTTQHELARAYPGCTFVGRVVVEQGATIKPGAVLRQTGSRPLYILGGSTIGAAARITQRGHHRLVLLHATVGDAATCSGNGVVARSTLSSGTRLRRVRATSSNIGGAANIRDSRLREGVVRGAVTISDSLIEGVAVGDAERPLQLGGAHIGAMDVCAPPGYRSERSSVPGIFEGVRVFGPKGREAASKAVLVVGPTRICMVGVDNHFTAPDGTVIW